MSFERIKDTDEEMQFSKEGGEDDADDFVKQKDETVEKKEEEEKNYLPDDFTTM